MKKLLLALTVSLAASPAFSADRLSFRFGAGTWGPTLSERDLGVWLGRQKEVKAKLTAVGGSAVVARETDLRDSLRSSPDRSLARRVREAGPVERKVLIGSLPGMRTDPYSECLTLESCHKPVRMLHAAEAAQAQAAIRVLLRPWIVLQHARKGRMTVESAVKGERVLLVKLDGLSSTPLEIHAAPLPMGGVQLWTKGGANLDDLFGYERTVALNNRTLPKPAEPVHN